MTSLLVFWDGICAGLQPIAGGHLVVSTVILAALLALAALPRVPARAGHALALLGLAKLLVPAGLLAVAAASCGLDLPGWFGLPASAESVVDGAAPMAVPALAVPAPSATLSKAAWVGAIWVLVASGVLLVMTVRHARLVGSLGRTRSDPSQRELGALAEAARCLGLGHVPRLWRCDVAGPLVVGVIRPVVVVPPAAAELDDGELIAVLAHELAHVARRDTLAGAITAVVGCMFWFHPLVWLAARQRAGLAERACDRLVIDSVSGAAVYARAVARIGRLAACPSGAACMSRAHLARRLEEIMLDARPDWSRSARILLVVCAAAVVVAAGLVASVWTDRGAWAQSAAPQEQHEALFKLTAQCSRPREGIVSCGFEVTDARTHELLIAPRIMARLGEPATIRGGIADHDGVEKEVVIKAVVNPDGRGTAELTATRRAAGGGVEVLGSVTISLDAGAVQAAGVPSSTRQYSFSNDCVLHEDKQWECLITVREVTAGATVADLELHGVAGSATGSGRSTQASDSHYPRVSAHGLIGIDGHGRLTVAVVRNGVREFEQSVDVVARSPEQAAGTVAGDRFAFSGMLLRTTDGRVLFSIDITDRAGFGQGEMQSNRSGFVGSDGTAREEIRIGDLTLLATAAVTGPTTGRLDLEVRRGADVIERHGGDVLISASDDMRTPRPATGDEISLELDGAGLADVLGTFSRIIGRDIIVGVDVSGMTVSTVMKRVMWRDALTRILAPHGLAWRDEGTRIQIFAVQ